MCPISKADSLKDFPANPDDWVPPDGVKEELKAKEGSKGKNRQWKDESGRIVRRFDKDTPGKPGRQGVDHWHDETGRHVLPNREVEAMVKGKISDRFNELSFHDAILKRVIFDFPSSRIEFDTEYIVDSIEESRGVFRPIYRDARITLTGVSKCEVGGEWDPINKQTIYDFDLVEGSEDLRNLQNELGRTDVVQFQVYMSSNIKMDVYCKDFTFELDAAPRK